MNLAEVATTRRARTRAGKEEKGRKEKKECASKLREKEHASARKRKKGKEVVVCTESVGSL